jgi:hypothetical protein
VTQESAGIVDLGRGTGMLEENRHISSGIRGREQE